MSVPDFQTLMLPVLKYCANGEVSSRETVEEMCHQFNLTDDERKDRIPSGKQTRISNRMSWAKGYLKQAGLLRYTRHAYFEITDEGRAVLAQNLDKINMKFLEQFEGYREFKNRRGETSQSAKDNDSDSDSDNGNTPDELLRQAYEQINDSLMADILSRMREATPAFFEEVLVKLLLAMGYGGTPEGVGEALVVGGPGDDGIDGVIDQDPLGLDQVYIQAKRYKEGSKIGSDAIRNFSGALEIRNAQKGIFITASSFSEPAKQTAEKVNKRIVLIGGLQLAELMLRYNIGCRDEEIFSLKKVDDEFFEQGERN